MCVFFFASVSVCVPYLHEHDEAHEEGEEADAEEEQLPAVLPAEHGRVHVDDRRDQALHTHKLAREGKMGDGKNQRNQFEIDR